MKNKKINIKSNEDNINKSIKKKTYFWLFLFPPYGMYLGFKHKTINKWVMTIFLAIFTFTLVISIDMALYPNRVYDKQAQDVMKKESLGAVRKVLRLNNIKYGDRVYHSYLMTTTTGKYMTYLASDNGKDYTVKNIYQIIPVRKHIKGEMTNKYFPEVLELFNDAKYGELLSLVATKSEDSQIIKSTMGEYLINITNNKVSSILKKDDRGAFASIYSMSTQLEMMPEMKKIYNEGKYGKVNSIIKYEFESDSEIQYISTSKGLYKFIVYDDGRISISKAN